MTFRKTPRFVRKARFLESSTAVLEKPPLKEKVPPGWSDADVAKLTGDNTNALAWYLHGRGVTPIDATENAADFQAACECFAKESNAAGSMGQLTRYRKPNKESARGDVSIRVRFLESAQPDTVTREIPVCLIEEGMGNPDDRHVYTREALQKAAETQLFEGSKAGADHPSKTQQVDRPEGSIRDIVGYYHGVKYVESNGKGQLHAILKIANGSAFNWVWDLLTEAVAYSKKYPNKVLVGLSINAGGITHQDKWVDGEPADIVDEITHVSRVDIVTQPGAGGKPLGDGLQESVHALFESAKSSGGNLPMKEKLKKVMEALAKVREAMKAAPEHDKAYGASMDEAMKEMAAMSSEEAAPNEPAAEPKGKPAEGDGGGDGAGAGAAADEDEHYAQESSRYASGKMNAGEKVLFERWSKSRATAQLQESEVAKGKNLVMIEKKLKESGLPEKTQADLRLILSGREEKYVEAMISDRKNLLESISGNRANGSGAAGGNEPASGKLQEALTKSGIPFKKA